MQFDRKQYIEWVARTSPDIEFSGVTVVTRDKTGQLSTLPILSTEGICHHDDPTNVLHFDSCCTGGRAAAFRRQQSELHRSRGALLGWHSEAGIDPKVSALVYVAARAPDAGEDYGALAATFPKPPASAGLIESDGYTRLNEEAFVKYFAGDYRPGESTRSRTITHPAHALVAGLSIQMQYELSEGYCRAQYPRSEFRILDAALIRLTTNAFGVAKSVSCSQSVH